MQAPLKAIPYVCPVCIATEDEEAETNDYYGRLVFPGEVETPTCPNHSKKKVVALVPAHTWKENLDNL